jgi:hypothetical protein
MQKILALYCGVPFAIALAKPFDLKDIIYFKQKGYFINNNNIMKNNINLL